MRLRISSRNVEIPQSLREYVSTEVEGLTKYFEKILDVDVTISQEKHLQKVDVRLHVNGRSYLAEAAGENLKVPVDAVIEKLRRQLERHKSKRQRQSLRADELVLSGKEPDAAGAAPALPELPTTDELPKRLRRSRRPGPRS